jgi:hypothetical protein
MITPILLSIYMYTHGEIGYALGFAAISALNFFIMAIRGIIHIAENR